MQVKEIKHCSGCDVVNKEVMFTGCSVSPYIIESPAQLGNLLPGCFSLYQDRLLHHLELLFDCSAEAKSRLVE